MSLLLGVFILEPILIQTSTLLQILKQLKHYLTLQTSITLSQNQHSFTITSSRKLFSPDSNNQNQFVIPKHFSYLFTHYQKIYVENQEDLQFFDVCYECLMVVREYLPSKVDIRVEVMEEMESGVGGEGMGLADFLQNFENQKHQEFLRRINSNFKSLVSHNDSTISTHEVENLLFMIQHFYYYKNKLGALKYIAHNQHIPKQVFAQIGETSLDFLKQLCLDQDFRNYCEKVVEKVAVAKEILMNQNEQNEQSEPESFQGQQNSSGSKYSRNDPQYDIVDKSNAKSHLTAQKQLRLPKDKQSVTKPRPKERSPLKLSSKQNLNLNRQSQNISNQDQLKNLSVKSLLFQLRESESLKRIAMLIEAASKMKIQDQKYEIKVQKQVQNICRRFLKQSYFERYETNQSVHAKQKSHLMDESFIPTREQVDQVSKFYQSLVSYFSRKDPSIKIPKGQPQNSRDKSIKSTKNLEINAKYKGLLDQICQKIEKKYYVQ